MRPFLGFFEVFCQFKGEELEIGALLHSHKMVHTKIDNL